MHLRCVVILTLTTVAILGAGTASAQPAVDRLVGTGEADRPLIITKVDGQAIGSLSKAAGVPMGFEGLPAVGRELSIVSTGKPLAEVLDAIVAADARYEWREDNGVILIRPVAAWADPMSSLHAAVGAVTLRETVATDVLDVVARMVGVRTPAPAGPADTRRFSVEVPEGATLLEALNAIVRAHGTLTWALQPSFTGDINFPKSIMLFVGPFGVGVGIPAGAVPVRLTNHASPLASSRSASDSLLDRRVGTRRDGQPVVVAGVGASYFFWELAGAAGVPMGFEALGSSERRPVPRAGPAEVQLTGLTLRDALDTLVRLDPRYEWRDMDGLIVVRPVTAWSNAADPLYRLVDGLRLDEAPVSRMIGAFASLLGAPEYLHNSFPDTRRFSVDVARSTALDVINAIARSHGELCWAWEEMTEEDQRFFGGRRYQLTFSVLRGGAHGFAIP
jgi:hypothetical protein